MSYDESRHDERVVLEFAGVLVGHHPQGFGLLDGSPALSMLLI